MKRTGIMGIIALLAITAAIAACTQPIANEQYDNAIIRYKLYGGFVMQTYAVQELEIIPGYKRTNELQGMPDTPPRATFTITGADGTVTKRFVKELTQEQYDAIIKAFEDNKFGSFGSKYIDGEKYVTDVGFADITLTANGKTKTVKTYNVDDYMPQGLIEIRELLQQIINDMVSQKVELSFRPRQCEQTVWAKWEADSGRVYIRTPADEEIIKAYYAETYGIEVFDVQKVSLNEAVCEACGCNESFRFTLNVEGSYEDALINEGWVRIEVGG